MAIKLVKTHYGYPYVSKGYGGREQRVARVDIGYVYHCTKCDEYFTDQRKVKEHDHGTRNKRNSD